MQLQKKGGRVNTRKKKLEVVDGRCELQKRKLRTPYACDVVSHVEEGTK